MTYAAQSFVSNIDLGKYLKVFATNGVYNNLSDASEMWKMFMKLKARDPGGRKITYLLRTSYGPGAVQSLPAGSSGDYPRGQRSGLVEGTAEYKEFGLTVNIPRNLLNKRGKDLLQYADPVTEELDAKAIASARVMSLETQGDGSGAIGLVSGAPSVSTSADTITVTLSTLSSAAGRSHIGWFMEDDMLKFASDAGVAQGTINNTATTVDYWKVISRDDDANTVTLKPYTSADAAIDITTATLGATDPASGDYIYRYGTTPNDLTAISSNDYNTLSECMVGLESLLADDGRLVNGITHSGAVSGTRRDCNGAQIDANDFQRVLSKAKRRGGAGRYKYSKAWMFDDVYDAFVEAHATDRRFTSAKDGVLGVERIGFQHKKDFVEFMPDEFVSKQRIWILPDSKEVLEMHGKDFQLVEPNPGQKFHLKTSSTGAGHKREMQSYMEGSAVVIVKHAAACAVIEDFAAA